MLIELLEPSFHHFILIGWRPNAVANYTFLYQGPTLPISYLGDDSHSALFVVGISIILYVFLEILGTRFWEAAVENLAFIFLPACFFAVYCDMRKVNTWNEVTNSLLVV